MKQRKKIIQIKLKMILCHDKIHGLVLLLPSKALCQWCLQKNKKEETNKEDQLLFFLYVATTFLQSSPKILILVEPLRNLLKAFEKLSTSLEWWWGYMACALLKKKRLARKMNSYSSST